MVWPFRKKRQILTVTRKEVADILAAKRAEEFSCPPNHQMAGVCACSTCPKRNNCYPEQLSRSVGCQNFISACSLKNQLKGKEPGTMGAELIKDHFDELLKKHGTPIDRHSTDKGTKGNGGIMAIALGGCDGPEEA